MKVVDCYRLPLLFTRLFETDIRDLSRCSEEESIDQNLEMIIMTCPGEHKYDPDFGCKIWDLDFERVVSMHRWEGQFMQYIQEAISKYERRIQDVDTRIKFYDIRNEYDRSGAISIRKRVDAQIDATIVSSKKKCCFYYSFFLGPLSSE